MSDAIEDFDLEQAILASMADQYSDEDDDFKEAVKASLRACQAKVESLTDSSMEEEDSDDEITVSVSVSTSFKFSGPQSFKFDMGKSNKPVKKQRRAVEMKKRRPPVKSEKSLIAAKKMKIEAPEVMEGVETCCVCISEKATLKFSVCNHTCLCEKCYAATPKIDYFKKQGCPLCRNKASGNVIIDKHGRIVV